MTHTLNVRYHKYHKRAKFKDGFFGARYYAIVYAILAPEVRRIKIGRTLDMKARLATLNGASPIKLQLIGHLWMPDDTEAYIHDYLKDDRSHCEWFFATEKVRSVAALIGGERHQFLADEVGLSGLLKCQSFSSETRNAMEEEHSRWNDYVPP